MIYVIPESGMLSVYTNNLVLMLSFFTIHLNALHELTLERHILFSSEPRACMQFVT